MAIFGRLRDHPIWLETPYQLIEKVFRWLNPLIKKIGYKRVDRWMIFSEKIVKELIFDCKMCGQCTLHFTGMTCPMTCPKNLRNGPCGGVRSNKRCEVDSEMNCVWVEAYKRSTRMKIFGDGIESIRAPLDYRLAGSSAFINLLRCEDDNVCDSFTPAEPEKYL